MADWIETSGEEDEATQRLALKAAIEPLRGLTFQSEYPEVRRKLFAALAAVEGVVNSARDSFRSAHPRDTCYGPHVEESVVVATAFAMSLDITVEDPHPHPHSQIGELLCCFASSYHAFQLAHEGQNALDDNEKIFWGGEEASLHSARLAEIERLQEIERIKKETP